jgi:hypothetical protein
MRPLNSDCGEGAASSHSGRTFANRLTSLVRNSLRPRSSCGRATLEIDVALKNLKKLEDADIPIAAGTDAGEKEWRDLSC